MFRVLLCPSSGAHDYSVDYNMGRPVLGLLLVAKILRRRIEKKIEDVL